jgi:hypothetical protein
MRCAIRYCADPTAAFANGSFDHSKNGIHGQNHRRSGSQPPHNFSLRLNPLEAYAH